MSIYRTGYLGEASWETQFNQAGHYHVRKVTQEWDFLNWPLWSPFWGAPAVLGDYLDYNSEIISITKDYDPNTAPQSGWYSMDVLKIFNENSIDNLSKTGFLLTAKNKKPFSGSGGRAIFASLKASTVANRPKLTITYSLGQVDISNKIKSINKSVKKEIQNGNLSLVFSENINSLKIYSLNGQMVYSNVNNEKLNAIKVSLKSIPAGTYIYAAESVNNIAPFKGTVVVK